MDRPPTAAELAELWVEPANAISRDLYYGVGGRDLAPDPEARYDLLSEEHDWSYSPGYKVRDPQGREWDVKLGKEVRPEVLASRLIWAVGYHQPPLYYVPHWTLYRNGKAEPQPEARFRPKLPWLRKHHHWSWQQNPYIGTRQYNGLVVLMLMLNNWDLTTDNNSIYELDRKSDGASRWYVVRDVGASFSRNFGSLLDGTRGDLEGFAHERFIRRVQDDRVVFAWTGQHRDLMQNIPPDDVRWIAARLAALTPKQWDDAFRAAAYAPAESELIRRKLAERIAQAQRL